MTQPDDKSLRNILKRVIGNLAQRVPVPQEPVSEEPEPPAPLVRPIRSHENHFAELRLQENFGWPSVQPRNDIHENISGAEEILREEAVYRSFVPLCDMTAKLMIYREGLAIDLHRNDGTWLTGQRIEIEFKKFPKGSDAARMAESDRIVNELEDNGFFFTNRDRVLHAFDYVLSTWIIEVSEPVIECKQGPEPISFG